MDYQKLLELQERCISDEPAATTAWCPIHIDVAAFNLEMEKGDFKKAYKVLEKRMPFPRLIGMICDHPCEQKCVREKIDRAISVGELERAAVSYGCAPSKKALSPPKTSGKVAVIGGGISGLIAALELDKKGFAVTIYEQSERLGGRLWNYEGKCYEKKVIEEEMQTVQKLGISVNYHYRIENEELHKIIEEYDAVYLGTGKWEKELQIDPQTFQVGGLSLFAGGGLYHKDNSIIYSVSSGKRAAFSIERFVKKISMTAERGREGSFVTPLDYNLQDAVPAERVEKSGDVYSEAEAIEEAKRCLKCRCNQCSKGCSHLRRFNMSQKGYAKQIYINENVIMGTRYANKMINSCAMCGLCGEQCSHGNGMEDIIRATRESMVEKGKMPVSAHDFALKDMEFSNSDRFFLVKSPPPIPEEKREQRERELFTYPRITFSNYAQSLYKGDKPGTEKVDYLFYPGCQLSASYPEYVDKTYHYLLDNIKEGVGIMLGCCGAPADWAGRQDLMKESAERIKNTWLEMGKPTFILACSSCSRVFERYLKDINYVALWEIFVRYGLPKEAKKGGGSVLNVHDACGSRHNKIIHESVRKIALELDYKIDELKYTREKTKCCGYGGLVFYANREQARDFVKDRMDESSKDLLVYCAMCKDLFVEEGKRTYHILDLIFGEDMEKLAAKKMPNLSERHVNRAHLKQKLLKDLWGEEPEAKKENILKLIIPPEVWKIMDERFILFEDIEKVVAHAQNTGERFFNPENSNYLANLRIENVTYWVRYEEKEDGILVSSVYSHRMEVAKE